MVKIALQILLIIGIVTVYILAIIAATVILVKISQGSETADDFDYAMTAIVIQAFVTVVIIAEKVAQWMT